MVECVFVHDVDQVARLSPETLRTDLVLHLLWLTRLNHLVARIPSFPGPHPLIPTIVYPPREGEVVPASVRDESQRPASAFELSSSSAGQLLPAAAPTHWMSAQPPLAARMQAATQPWSATRSAGQVQTATEPFRGPAAAPGAPPPHAVGRTLQGTSTQHQHPSHSHVWPLPPLQYQELQTPTQVPPATRRGSADFTVLHPTAAYPPPPAVAPPSGLPVQRSVSSSQSVRSLFTAGRRIEPSGAGDVSSQGARGIGGTTQGQQQQPNGSAVGVTRSPPEPTDPPSGAGPRPAATSSAMAVPGSNALGSMTSHPGAPPRVEQHAPIPAVEPAASPRAAIPALSTLDVEFVLDPEVAAEHMALPAPRRDIDPNLAPTPFLGWPEAHGENPGLDDGLGASSPTLAHDGIGGLGFLDGFHV